MPSALPAMWRVLKLGYRHEPRLLLGAFAISQLAALPDALVALWLKLLGEGVLRGDPRAVMAAAGALAVSAALTWILVTVSTRVQRRFRDKVTIALEAHVARLQAEIADHRAPGAARLPRPPVGAAQPDLRPRPHVHVAVLDLRVDPARRRSRSPCSPPSTRRCCCSRWPPCRPSLTSGWRPAVERAVEERVAADARLAAHLFQTATTAAPGKEVRATGIGSRLVRDRRAAWERWYAPVAAARNGSAAWHALAWAAFGAAYVGAIVFVAAALRRPAGDVLLVLAAGSRLSAFIGAAVSEIGFLRGIWMDGSRRLCWLEDYAAGLRADGDREAPASPGTDIRLEGVSFCYPGTDRRVLEDVSVVLPAGAVVALVGENGAGKSTLVKLLCKLYEPTEGRIVSGPATSRSPRCAADRWRRHLSGAFQDFFRFELPARQSIGLGDLPRMGDDAAVRAAVARAGADDVVARLPHGLDTQLGPTWPGGVEVSFGQWQKLALARAFMRERPLLLVLDEPTAALDAETEHALFERYAAAARGGASGAGVTVLVSHRFSTVRMADLIVVLDGARVAEVGSHEELVARGGTYAELYGIQAAAYR